MRLYKITVYAISVIVIFSALHITAIAQTETFKGKLILESTWRGERTKYVAGEIVVMFQDNGVDGNSYAQRVNGKLSRGVEDDVFAIHFLLRL